MRWVVARFGPMYRGMWCTVAVVLAALGVVGSFVLLGPGGALLLGGMAAGLTALSGWRLRALAETGGPRLSPVVVSLLAGMVALAVVGLIVELGQAGLWLSLIVAAAGWPALRCGRRAASRRHRAPGVWRSFFGIGASSDPIPRSETPRAEPPAADAAPVTARSRQESRTVILFDAPALEQLPPESMPPLSQLSSLSTAQLCWAWRVSYVKAHQATCGSLLQHLAELRRGYLDELERRDPVAFSRWFPTARAASDPARFFCCPSSPAPSPAARPAQPQRNDASRGPQTSGAAG